MAQALVGEVNDADTGTKPAGAGVVGGLVAGGVVGLAGVVSVRVPTVVVVVVEALEPGEPDEAEESAVESDPELHAAMRTAAMASDARPVATRRVRCAGRWSIVMVVSLGRCPSGRLRVSVEPIEGDRGRIDSGCCGGRGADVDGGAWPAADA